MRSHLTKAPSIFLVALALQFGGLLSSPAQATPGSEALDEFFDDQARSNNIENRFFLKSKRFEVAPVGGYVPNNPMVKRFVGGVLMAYHFSESLSVGSQILYSPDLEEKDLKGLTEVLVDIAATGSADGVEFQQPLDKMLLGATFSANWAPIYGKINLFGEAVLNFDLYGSVGLGMLSIAKYAAVYDESASSNENYVNLETPTNEVRVPGNVGVGMDFFINQSIAFKVDVRSYLYVDTVPQYDPDTPVTEKRLYNNLITSAGISVFLPKMQTRITEF